MLLRVAVLLLLTWCTTTVWSQRVDVHTTPHTIRVLVSGLGTASYVQPHDADVDARLVAHPAVRRPFSVTNPSMHDVLLWTIAVPHSGTVRATMQVHAQRHMGMHHLRGLRDSLTPTVLVQRAGAYGDQAVATLMLQPWLANATELGIADSIEITISFSDAMQQVAPSQHLRLPAFFPPILNPSMRSVKAFGGKQGERVQGAVDPALWYDPARPYVRLTTTRDGIARITAEAVAPRQPALIGLRTETLALYYKGQQQPIGIADANADGVFNLGDTVYFLGRRSQGDTTWFNLQDTVSVFFLTTGGGRRLELRTPSDANAAQTDRLRLHAHIELDTGYYHLGNAPDADRGEYNSDWVTAEGFYWTFMNARTRDTLHHDEVTTPVGDGDATLTAHIVTITSSPQYEPEHRTALMVNGLDPFIVQTQGKRFDSIVVQGPNTLVAGATHMGLYAVGIKELLDSTGYLSQICLDNVTIDADVRPFLYQGSLLASVQAQVDRPTTFTVTGINGGSVMVLDTTRGMLSRIPAGARGTTIRASIVPANPPTWDAVQTVPTSSISLVVNDSATAWTMQSGFAAAAFDGSAVVTTQTSRADEFDTWLRALPPSSSIAMASVRATISQALRSTLTSLGVQDQNAPVWTSSMVKGQSTTASTQTSAESNGRVSTSTFLPVANGVHRTATAVVERGPERTLVIVDAAHIEDAVPGPAHLRNLRSMSAQTDVIYIVHTSHRAEAERLAAHRRSVDNLHVTLVDVDDIIDEFGAGHRSPEAVKAFLKDAYERWPLPRPTSLLLIGNASYDARLAIRKGNLRSSRPDQVPTYGRPSSDYWFGLLEGDDVSFPELTVGRLPVLTPDETKNIVDKIIEHDTIAIHPWMRRVFFVGGGTEEEGFCSMYQDLLTDPFGTGYTLTGPPLCIDTITVCKADDITSAGYRVKQGINSGVTWMNYLGHGATELFDIPGWNANELNNAGKCGMLATYACQTGAYSTPSNICKNATYLVEPRNGFIGAVGGTGWTYKQTVANLHFGFNDAMKNGSRTMADIVYRTKTPFAIDGVQEGINTCMQQCILGDPLSRIRIDTVPDAYLRPQDVTVTDRAGDAQITVDDDSVLVTMNIQNAGTGTTTALGVRVIRTYGSTADTVTVVSMDGICTWKVVRCTLDIADRVGEHTLQIQLNPDTLIRDERLWNNALTVTFQVVPRSLLPVEPQPYWSVAASDLAVRMVNPLSTSTPVFDFVITRGVRDVNPSTIVARSVDAEVHVDGTVIDWRPSVVLDTGSHYLHARYIDGADTSATVTIPFNVITTPHDATITTRTDHLDVPASAALGTERTDEGIMLDRYTLPISMRSSGIQTADLLNDRIILISVGATAYANNPYGRGVNIVVVGAHDTIPRAVRRYDTYQYPVPREAGHDGFSHDCIAFLRDSVADDERLLIAVGDESFSGFVRDTTMDSLRTILKTFGSRYADSLDVGASWAMVAVRGMAIGQPTERFKAAPDSMVVIDSTLDFIARAATIITPWIGPAKGWTSWRVEGSGHDSARTYLEGRTAAGETVLVDSLQGGMGSWIAPASLGPITFLRSRTVVPFVDWNSSRVTFTSSASTYTPADEWLIDSLRITPDSVLRADTAALTYTIRNVYRTFAAPTTSCAITGYDSTLSIPSLQADDRTHVQMLVPTALLPDTTILTATINAQQLQPELYRFNNSAATTLHVAPDTTAPTIELRIDGIHATDGMMVLPTPLFEVLLHDNSRLIINDSTRITVFINGDRIKASNTTEYQFLNTIDAQLRYGILDVRAAEQFRYVLDLDQNNVSIRVSDASGNAARKDLAVYTTDHTTVQGITVAPNPFSGATSFIVRLASDLPTVPASIAIYDLQGGLVRTLDATVSMGTSVVAWDGKGQGGESLASGLYVWRYTANDPAGASAVVGSIVLIR